MSLLFSTLIKSLNGVFEKLHEYDGKDIDLQDLWAFQGMVNSLANNPEDYRSFYHNVDGKMVRHDKVHNLYGYNMTRSASEAFDKIAPGRRILMFSRSSYIGMHRYGGIWTGDNASWWSHIELIMHQLPALNMCVSSIAERIPADSVRIRQKNSLCDSSKCPCLRRLCVTMPHSVQDFRKSISSKTLTVSAIF